MGPFKLHTTEVPHNFQQKIGENVRRRFFPKIKMKEGAEKIINFFAGAPKCVVSDAIAPNYAMVNPKRLGSQCLSSL